MLEIPPFFNLVNFNYGASQSIYKDIQFLGLDKVSKEFIIKGMRIVIMEFDSLGEIFLKLLILISISN